MNKVLCYVTLCYTCNLEVLLFNYISCLNNVCISIKYYYKDLMFHVFTKDPMEQYRDQKNFDVLIIFYVVLSTHSILLSILLSTWSVVLPICHVLCLIVLCLIIPCSAIFHSILYQRMLFAIIYFIIWPCVKRTGNKQIQEFDWLKSILTAI